MKFSTELWADLWVTGLTVLIDFAGMPKALAARRPRTVWLENLVVAAGEHNRFQTSLHSAESPQKTIAPHLAARRIPQ